MSKLNLTFIVLSFLFLVGCSKGLEKKDFDDQLWKLDIDIYFRLDRVGKAKWDKVYIVKSYSNFNPEEKGLKKNEELSKMLANFDGFDSHCILLFVKDETCVAYSKMARGIADFSHLEAESYPSDQLYYLGDNRIVCID